MHDKLREAVESIPGVRITDVAQPLTSEEREILQKLSGQKVPDEWPRISPDGTIYIPPNFPHSDHALAHEAIHATRSHLGRDHLNEACCHKHGYMLEELTAELGREILTHKLGISPVGQGWSILHIATKCGMPFHTALAIALRGAQEAVNFILAPKQ
jgi:hypothetical protein